MTGSRIVEGSPKEIADQIRLIVGERRVSVLLLDEVPGTSQIPPSESEFEAAMAEIRNDAVNVPHADDSREAIYTPQDGE